MGLDSHVRPTGEPRGNVNTECFPQAGGPRVVPDLRAAYAFARAVVGSAPDGMNGRPGHRLVWVRKAAFGGVPLVAHADAFAIVGRHSQCGLVLADDPFVALRHILVRSVILPTGKPALRLLDLHTDAGFTLTDGSQQASVFAEGPVAVGVGEYALVALPTETPEDALPKELPAPDVLALPPRAVGSPYRDPPVRSKTSNRLSRITLMPHSVMLGSQMPAISVGRMVATSRWAVTLERGGHSATITVNADDLTGGVVLGRSEKCVSEDLRRITDNNTSRVHLLILREGNAIHAFDLASTQGTYLGGVPMRHLELDDNGTILLLGKQDSAVRLFWRRA